MKRILHINVTYKHTSTGSIEWEIMNYCRDHGIESKALYQLGDCYYDEHSEKYESKIEYIFRTGMNKFFGPNQIYLISETIKLINEIKRYKPDLIHIHVIHSLALHYPMLYRFLIKYQYPVVYTMDDCWAYTGGCFHYTEAGCFKYQNDCKECPKHSKMAMDCYNFMTSYHLRLKKKYYDKLKKVVFVGVSQWIANEASKSIIKNHDIRVIYNGIDTCIYKPRKSESQYIKEKLLQGREHLIIGVADHWNDRKGLYKFVELARNLYGKKYQIVLIGRMDDNVISKPDNMTFYGRIDNKEELVLMYNAADVLVNMSIEESFGLVTAEASSVGIPVIAMNSTANSELIRLVNGTLLDTYDILAIKKSIYEICKKQNDINNNLEQVRKRLSKETMLENYLSLYKELLD